MGSAILALLLATGACGDGVEVTARPYSVNGDCFGSPAPVGTADQGAGCDDAFVYAKARNGLCFEFKNSCIPSGFEVVGYDATSCGSGDPTPHGCSP
jgi:hypothetical protein